MSESKLIKIEDGLLKRVSDVINITDKLLALGEKNIKDVIIGDQIWMVENLNVSNFQNGDPIPEAKTDEEWQKAGQNEQPAWCYYANDPLNGVKYGKLYNWYAVIDPRGLSPHGWHVPDELEFDKLINYLGGKDIGGKKMKSENDWMDNGNGTNESGFSGLPGGHRGPKGTFADISIYSHWWSSTEKNTGNAWFIYLFCQMNIVGWVSAYKAKGMFVRCLRDETV
jgi:uncharacterized protein (TIGR02145 family)